MLSLKKEVAIDSRLSPAKVRWRQPAVSSELSLVTASLKYWMVYGQKNQ